MGLIEDARAARQRPAWSPTLTQEQLDHQEAAVRACREFAGTILGDHADHAEWHPMSKTGLVDNNQFRRVYAAYAEVDGLHFSVDIKEQLIDTGSREAYSHKQLWMLQACPVHPQQWRSFHIETLAGVATAVETPVERWSGCGGCSKDAFAKKMADGRYD